MQPLISYENVEKLTSEILADVHKWRKDMIHYVMNENPELNTAIIEISQKAELDPKALALGAYMTYKLLENESANNIVPDFDFSDEDE